MSWGAVGAAVVGVAYGAYQSNQDKQDAKGAANKARDIVLTDEQKQLELINGATYNQEYSNQINLITNDYASNQSRNIYNYTHNQPNSQTSQANSQTYQVNSQTYSPLEAPKINISVGRGASGSSGFSVSDSKETVDKLTQENLDFQMDRYMDFKAIYGVKQEAAEEYYSNLTGMKLVGPELEAIQVAAQQAEKRITARFAARGITNSGLEIDTLNSNDYLSSIKLATVLGQGEIQADLIKKNYNDSELAFVRQHLDQANQDVIGANGMRVSGLNQADQVINSGRAASANARNAGASVANQAMATSVNAQIAAAQMETSIFNTNSNRDYSEFLRTQGISRDDFLYNRGIIREDFLHTQAVDERNAQVQFNATSDLNNNLLNLGLNNARTIRDNADNTNRLNLGVYGNSAANNLAITQQQSTNDLAISRAQGDLTGEALGRATAAIIENNKDK